MRLAPKVKMVHQALQDVLEMMVPLENLDQKDHLVIKAMVQLSKIVADAHHILHLKVIRVLSVNQEILVYLADLVNQVLLVNLVSAFLVTVERVEKLVNQAVMELMVDLVNQVSLEDLEMQLMSRILPTETILLT